MVLERAVLENVEATPPPSAAGHWVSTKTDPNAFSHPDPLWTSQHYCTHRTWHRDEPLQALSLLGTPTNSTWLSERNAGCDLLPGAQPGWGSLPCCYQWSQRLRGGRQHRRPARLPPGWGESSIPGYGLCRGLRSPGRQQWEASGFRCLQTWLWIHRGQQRVWESEQEADKGFLTKKSHGSSGCSGTKKRWLFWNNIVKPDFFFILFFKKTFHQLQCSCCKRYMPKTTTLNNEDVCKPKMAIFQT